MKEIITGTVLENWIKINRFLREKNSTENWRKYLPDYWGKYLPDFCQTFFYLNIQRNSNIYLIRDQISSARQQLASSKERLGRNTWTVNIINKWQDSLDNLSPPPTHQRDRGKMKIYAHKIVIIISGSSTSLDSTFHFSRRGKIRLQFSI